LNISSIFSLPQADLSEIGPFNEILRIGLAIGLVVVGIVIVLWVLSFLFAKLKVVLLLAAVLGLIVLLFSTTSIHILLSRASKALNLSGIQNLPFQIHLEVHVGWISKLLEVIVASAAVMVFCTIIILALPSF
jgi:hypothetical protein